MCNSTDIDSTIKKVGRFGDIVVVKFDDDGDDPLPVIWWYVVCNNHGKIKCLKHVDLGYRRSAGIDEPITITIPIGVCNGLIQEGLNPIEFYSTNHAEMPPIQVSLSWELLQRVPRDELGKKFEIDCDFAALHALPFPHEIKMIISQYIPVMIM